MKRVLVTGANGQLGRSIRDIAGLYPNLGFLFAGRETLDITDPVRVRAVFAEYRPDYCINCAAYTRVEEAEKDPAPAFEVNAGGVRNLVEACRQEDTVLIHISTDYVFDGRKKGAYLPEDTPNPINEYGKSKLAGEAIIRDGMTRYRIVRTSWLYSRKYAPNFYQTILKMATAGETLRVTDAQRGCPTDADNLARHLLDLVDSGFVEPGVSHFTDRESRTWYEFARDILKEHGMSESVRLVKDNKSRSFARRPENSVLR